MTDETEGTARPTDGSSESLITFKQFLEAIHPSVVKRVSGVWEERRGFQGSRFIRVLTPELRLHCERCDGERTFRSNSKVEHMRGPPKVVAVIAYLCGDCLKHEKSFFLWLAFSKAIGNGSAYKYGEKPPFGVPVS